MKPFLYHVVAKPYNYKYHVRTSSTLTLLLVLTTIKLDFIWLYICRSSWQDIYFSNIANINTGITYVFCLQHTIIFSYKLWDRDLRLKCYES